MQQSNSARILHQIHRPILHSLCLYVFLSTMIPASLPFPIPQNRVDNTTEVLMSVVQEAVNTSSLTSFNLINLTSSLTNRLVQIIQEKGIKLSYESEKCFPQTSEYLQKRFKSDINLDGVTLTSINMTKNGCSEEVSIATPDPAEPSSTSVIGYFSEFSDDYFPRFSVGVKCSSMCDSEDTGSYCECTSGYYRLLKRKSGCDDDGREVWERENVERTITIACGCSSGSSNSDNYG